ncbi:hypothetical protein VNO80_26043 [Phaseolus coccineus]|uniref:Uncharacterized protein n=1 Tax=Phaseolus coccineus TaxID=3886 RepID=A0AAN9LV95_PHACN
MQFLHANSMPLLSLRSNLPGYIFKPLPSQASAAPSPSPPLNHRAKLHSPPLRRHSAAINCIRLVRNLLRATLPRREAPACPARP